MLMTTVLMAAAGALFWMVAARLHDQATVGLAGSLVAGVVMWSLAAQLGVNVTVVRVLPSSSNPAADVAWASALTGAAGFAMGAAYAWTLPWTSPALAEVVDGTAEVLLYGVLVGATAVNLTSDSVFLVRRRLSVNLLINGVLLGAAKLVLPFLLVGAGALGLVASVGLASVLAAVVSMAVLMRRLLPLASGGGWRPSAQLVAQSRFTGAGYLASLFDLAPILVLPMMVVNAAGAQAGAVYFVGFQVATLLNSVAYAVGSSMYAEASRSPDRADAVVRRSGLMLVAVVGAGVVGLVVAAPLLLTVFGAEYAASGTATLRVLGLSACAVAVSYWALVRLRIRQRLVGMWAVPLVASGTMLGLASMWADRGTVWVAAAWGLGHTAGAAVGLVMAGRR